MSRPWLRLNADCVSDSRLRRAGPAARLIWPHVLCALKRELGVATDDDLHPEALADYVGGDLELWESGLSGLKRVGLLVEVEREVRRGRSAPTLKQGWSTDSWGDYQPDARPRSSSRNVPVESVSSQGRSGTNRDKPCVPGTRAVPSRPVLKKEDQTREPDPVLAVWAGYVEGRTHQRKKPGKDARDSIGPRLKEFSVEELVLVSRWVLQAPDDYCRRQRESDYTTYSTIFKARSMQDRVDKAAAWARAGHPKAAPGSGPGSDRFDAWLAYWGDKLWRDTLAMLRTGRWKFAELEQRLLDGGLQSMVSLDAGDPRRRESVTPCPDVPKTVAWLLAKATAERARRAS